MLGSRIRLATQGCRQQCPDIQTRVTLLCSPVGNLSSLLYIHTVHTIQEINLLFCLFFLSFPFQSDRFVFPSVTSPTDHRHGSWESWNRCTEKGVRWPPCKDWGERLLQVTHTALVKNLWEHHDLKSPPDSFLLSPSTCDHQAARKAVNDSSMSSAAGSVASVGRVQLKLRKTLKGHLAKIYAMHWAADSRWGRTSSWITLSQIFVCRHFDLPSLKLKQLNGAQPPILLPLTPWDYWPIIQLSQWFVWLKYQLKEPQKDTWKKSPSFNKFLRCFDGSMSQLCAHYLCHRRNSKKKELKHFHFFL